MSFEAITANHYVTSELPKTLFESPIYEDMRLDSKVSYAFLRDRLELSLKNNWVDDKGRLYLIYSNTELMKILNCSKSTLLRIKKQLAEYGLMKNILKEKYDEKQESKQDDFEMQLTIEPWQIKRLTHQSIHVPITFGLDRKGIVSIPARMLDQNEDGTFTAYIKRNDFFYFLNADHSEQNGEMILTRNKNITNLDRLVDEFNFLAINHVTNSKQFENLQYQFLEQLSETDKTLETLDSKMSYLNKLLGALSDYQNNIIQSEMSIELLEKRENG